MRVGMVCAEGVRHPFDLLDTTTGVMHDQHKCRLGMANCWRCQRNYTHALDGLPEPMRSRLLEGFGQIVEGHRVGAS